MGAGEGLGIHSWTWNTILKTLMFEFFEVCAARRIITNTETLSKAIFGGAATFNVLPLYSLCLPVLITESVCLGKEEDRPVWPARLFKTFSISAR